MNWNTNTEKNNQNSDDLENAPSVKEIMSMEKALSERPSFSIRIRISLAFIAVFLFSFGISISSIFYISMLNSNQGFFERAAKFTFTVEQARRHEKNFFLYQSRQDLTYALKNIENAFSILNKTATEMSSLLKQKTFQKLKNDLSKYESLLKQIFSNDKIAHIDLIEKQLRSHGHSILSYSMDLMSQEHIKVHKAAKRFMLIAGFSILLNFIIMVWVAMELAHQILQPLGRAVKYTERIAKGNFSLIIPQRKFRDEFSNLAIAINRMIFELMEKHKQLVQSRKMAAVGTLTSGIAHELNNPLNNISLTAETLLESLEGFTHDEVMGMLNDIFIQVERASGIIRNLLDFTRLDHSELESLDIKPVIESCLKLIKNECYLKEIEPQVKLENDLPKVQGNYRNLQQVFLNIFLNAVQAIEKKGVLCVEAHISDDRFIKVDITDNGCGIAKKDVEKIFDPFFTTKDVGKGTGLGLSVSYGIMKDIGGHISVDSEKGRWTTFSVYLPLVKNIDSINI